MRKFNFFSGKQLLKNKLLCIIKNTVSSKFLMFFMTALTLTGCISPLENTSEIIAKHTATPVKIDGKIDDKIWKKACTYQLGLGRNAYAKYSPTTRRVLSGELVEHGEFKLLWDKDYIYVAIKYYDSDIVAEGRKDQIHQYAKGDVAEIFIKPLCETYYWELHVTPANKKTCFFLPGRGRLFLPSCGKANMTLITGVQVNGSINDWQDKDNYWTAEMAIPIKGITQHGAKWGIGTQWSIFISRYNYSRYLSIRELSSYPFQDVVNFHTIEDYAKVKFEK